MKAILLIAFLSISAYAAKEYMPDENHLAPIRIPQAQEVEPKVEESKKDPKKVEAEHRPMLPTAPLQE